MRHGYVCKVGRFPIRTGWSKSAKKFMKKLLGRRGGQGARGEENHVNWLHPRFPIRYPQLGTTATRMVFMGMSPRVKGALTFHAVRETVYEYDVGANPSRLHGRSARRGNTSS